MVSASALIALMHGSTFYPDWSDEHLTNQHVARKLKLYTVLIPQLSGRRKHLSFRRLESIV